MRRRSGGSASGGIHQQQPQQHGGMCSNDDLLANLHLSEVVNVQDHTQESRPSITRPQEESHDVSQKQKMTGVHQQQQQPKKTEAPTGIPIFFGIHHCYI